jgi:hypothetical protein
VFVAELRIAVSIIGGLVLMVGLGLAAWRARMLIGYKRRSAVVTTFLRQRGSFANAWAVRVTVRWTTEDGEEIQASDDAPWNAYAPGRQITVLQVPDSDPPRVVVPEFLRFWLLSLILVPFGGALLYAALFSFRSG